MLPGLCERLSTTSTAAVRVVAPSLVRCQVGMFAQSPTEGGGHVGSSQQDYTGPSSAGAAGGDGESSAT